jgi:hypothetical protein
MNTVQSQTRKQKTHTYAGRARRWASGMLVRMALRTSLPHVPVLCPPTLEPLRLMPSLARTDDEQWQISKFAIPCKQLCTRSCKEYKRTCKFASVSRVSQHSHPLFWEGERALLGTCSTTGSTLPHLLNYSTLDIPRAGVSLFISDAPGDPRPCRLPEKGGIR